MLSSQSLATLNCSSGGIENGDLEASGAERAVTYCDCAPTV